jgi:hypothetical protein
VASKVRVATSQFVCLMFLFLIVVLNIPFRFVEHSRPVLACDCRVDFPFPSICGFRVKRSFPFPSAMWNIPVRFSRLQLTPPAKRWAPPAKYRSVSCWRRQRQSRGCVSLSLFLSLSVCLFLSLSVSPSLCFFCTVHGSSMNAPFSFSFSPCHLPGRRGIRGAVTRAVAVPAAANAAAATRSRFCRNASPAAPGALLAVCCRVLSVL